MSEYNRHAVPLAVVGVSALFPGSVDKTGFWHDILAGKDLITDVPSSHWLVEDYYDADPTAPDMTYANRGAFIPDVDFDPMAWGVPPNIVPATDTNQLLALIVAKQVLDDATRELTEADRERVSIILGVTSAQELLGSMVSRLQKPVWQSALREMGLPEDEVQDACKRIASKYTPWQESTFPGVLGNVVAGRIANRLDLHGTNCVTDAACASTFSALSMAANELYLGMSDMVICGGADTMNDIFMYMCFSKTPALSKSGDCRPFSDKADGTMLGEGIGMVALKRLADAERDGDRVYAVIQGVGTSSDGRAKSVYAPVPAGQARCLRRAYNAAGFPANTVELIEAHGTGTKAGDAAEYEGLRSVFEETGREDRQWCALGSVKSQIGHTKSAAGAAGLFKAVMALAHKVLPPSIKIDKPNPMIDIAGSPFFLNDTAIPWVRSSDHPRRAGVSSFGFGGSNFHIAIEEYTGSNKAWRSRTAGSEAILLSGASGAAVAKAARDLAASVRSAQVAPKTLLQYLARTTQSEFDPAAPARLALLATDEADLASKLGQAADLAAKGQAASTPNGIHFGTGAHRGDTAFLFPGQGSQYVRMGADVATHYGRALDAWDAAADADLPESLHRVVFPVPAYTDAERDAQAAKLTQTEWAQPAIGVASLSLLDLLSDLGVKPAAVAGHSFGEVTALHAAGVLSAADAIAVARKRGELMAQASATVPGSMTAAVATIEQLQPLLDAWGTDVVVANHNGPKQVVLSGSTDAIAAVEAKLAGEGITAKRLNVATAFHSKLVSGSVGPFDEFLDGVKFGKASVPVYANATAAPYKKTAKAQRATLSEQIGNPVRFVEQIEAMYAAGVRTFIEVGPGSVLTKLVGRILKGREFTAVSLDKKGKNGVVALHDALAQLSAAGVALDFAPLWADFEPKADPRDARVPKLVMKLNGSNYGKPYPPKNGAAGRPKPNGPRPQPEARVVVKEVEKIVEKVVEKPVYVNTGGPVAPGSTPALPTHAPAAPGSDWLAAYQEAQSQTAAAHAAYQQAMAASHQSFLKSVEASFFGLAQMAGAPAAQPPAYGVPAPTRPMVTASTPAPVPSAQPAMPSFTSAPTTSSMTPSSVTPSVAASDFIPAANAAEYLGAATAATPAAGPTASTTASAVDVQGHLLAVVADKTGYPREMLSMSMDLEADLGVDSIKRVEILSGVREREPSLPETDPGAMGNLRTLGDIVDFMNQQLGATVLAPATSTPPAAASTSSLDLRSLMLDVVSEKTGYPASMIDLDMDLEADLGVDSIKRVEILSTMREREPAIPEVDAGELGKLSTLGQIVEYMGGSLQAPTTNGQAPRTTPSQSLDLRGLMLDVVSEKTGYPVDMIDLDMDLEADLGVDSIKRVEILSTMREREPAIPEVDAGELGKLSTLGQIVEFMGGATAAAGDNGHGGPSSLAGGPSSLTSSLDLRGLMLDVVSEKTGYPVDMIDLDMDLEADLGVDSIKRVEILSTMREREPAIPEVDAGELGKLSTLGQIVEFMGGSTAPAGDNGHGGPSSLAGGPSSLTSSLDLRGLMLDVVSEKTGYPVDMIDLDMDLEADLGVDSIKRVEILSTMREREPTIPEVDAGELGKLSTLGQIVEYMGGSVPAQGTHNQAPSTTPSAQPSTPALGRFALRLVPAQPTGLALGGLLGAKHVVVTDDGTGVAQALVDQLGERQVSASVGTPDAQTDALIFLGGLRDVADTDAAVQVNRDAFDAAKRVSDTLSASGGVFVTVQDTGGDFGLGGSERAWLGGLPGLVKTAAQEWPKAGVRAIDIQRGDRSPEQLAAILADELVWGGFELEVGLQADGSRWTLQSYRDAAPAGDAIFDANDVVVASGGARGVTAATLIALARATQCKLVLLGRTPLQDEPAAVHGVNGDGPLKGALLAAAKASGQMPKPAELGKAVKGILAGREIRATIAAVQAAGGDARYVSADVRDRKALSTALDGVRRDWGTITGLVHGAGVLADKLITEKTRDQFDFVFDTKVDGLRSLLEVIDPNDLKGIVFFSSVAARCGNNGQCDYAMANEVLNKVAGQLRADGKVVKSLGWGPWEGGMVTPALKAHFESMGVPLIPLDTGAQMLVDELVGGNTEQVELVLGGEPRPEALASSGGSPEVTVDILVDAKRNPYLTSHQVKGVPVVPVALVLEWIARAAKACRPTLTFSGATDIKVLSGIKLDGWSNGGDIYTLRARQLSNGDGAILSVDVLGKGGRKHYSATAEMIEGSATPGTDVPKTGALKAWSDEVYGDVLFHGPDFQVIRELEGVSDDGIAGELVGLGELGWGGHWTTDPALIDGGLQLALLYTKHALGGASLPTGMKSFHCYTEGPPTGVIRCVLRGRTVGKDKVTSDIVFLGGDGKLVAEMRGVDTHVLPGTRTSNEARA